MNHRTQTPVNAVWFVMVASGVLGTLGFSQVAFGSLAGASVIGLYTSYATPIFLRITSGRDKFKPGPFHLGRWYLPIGVIAVSWVSFIIVLLLFPPGQTVKAAGMNYAVLIIGAVFAFAAISWIVSAHKWFHGPIRNIDDSDVSMATKKPLCSNKCLSFLKRSAPPVIWHLYQENYFIQRGLLKLLQKCPDVLMVYFHYPTDVGPKSSPWRKFCTCSATLAIEATNYCIM